MHTGCRVAAGQLEDQFARWTAAIAAGETGLLTSVFAEHGAQGPSLTWRPVRDELQPEPLRFLLTHWTRLRNARPAPRAADIDALEMRPALGYILLLDVVDGGRDFRFRLFGSTIAAASGFDLTGRLMSAHPSTPYIVDFYRATYQAVLRRREPLATVHSPPVAVSTTVWHRLILPLVDADDAVVRLLGGVVPVARNGATITSGW